MKSNTGASAYARMGVESQVMSASPHKLISLLFDGAISACRLAIVHIDADRTAKKGEAISRAMDIINNGLLAALDQEKGGELAERLAALYEHMGQRLLYANLHNDKNALNEVIGLLEDIGSAWQEIDPTAPQQSQVPDKGGSS